MLLHQRKNHLNLEVIVATVRSVGLGVDVIAGMVVNVDRDAASHHKESRVLDVDLMVRIHTHITEECLTFTEKLAVCVQTVKRKSTEKGKKC